MCEKLENKDFKVTIILPCFNCEKFVESTIQSILRQTFKGIEIVCIDDGSKDGTLQVLQKLAAKNHNIRVYHQENCGVSAARNRGIQVSKTEYITFLDADDEYSPYYVESLVKAAQKSNCGVAYCRLTRNKNKLNVSHKSTHYDVQTQEQAMRNLLYNMGEIGFSCYIYNTKTLKERGLLFDEDIKYGEDRSLIWKYLSDFNNVAYVNEQLYWYRENDNSATKKRHQSWNRTDSIEAVKRTTKYLRLVGCGFVKEYKNYMYPRDMWTVSKAFAISGEMKLYKRFIKEYGVKKYMKITSNDKNRFVRLASRLFLINPMLFYIAIRCYGVIC